MSAEIERIEDIVPSQAWFGNVQRDVFFRWQIEQLMESRCRGQGHYWENCCSPLFRIYQKCKWCGVEK